MRTALAALRLTSDEIVALAAAMGVEHVLGITEPPSDSTPSPDAGVRSLAARELVDARTSETKASPAVAIVLANLASAGRRLTITDDGMEGTVATVSVAGSVVVIHRHLGGGIHEVAAVEREAGEAITADLLSRYSGTPDAGEALLPADAEGALALVIVHSTDPSATWIDEVALWVGDDGTVAEVREDGVTAVSGVDVQLLERLFA